MDLGQRDIFQDCYCQGLHSQSEVLLTHDCKGDPPTLAYSSGSVSCGVTALSPWVLVHERFVCALWEWNLCFPQFCGSPMIKSPWPSKSDFLGVLIPFAVSPVWEARCGAQSLHNSGRTSIVLFSSNFWVIHSAGIGFDYIMIAHLLLSPWGFFFFFFLYLMWGICFWWVPASSCLWLFKS